MFVLLTNVMRAKVHKILQTETFFCGRKYYIQPNMSFPAHKIILTPYCAAFYQSVQF